MQILIQQKIITVKINYAINTELITQSELAYLALYPFGFRLTFYELDASGVVGLVCNVGGLTHYC